MTATADDAKTQFAVNIEMWFEGTRFEERVENAAALGFPAIEFWFYKDRDMGELAERLNAHGMSATQFTAWGFGQEINDPRIEPEAFVAAIEESCDVANALPGCDLFTVVAGDDVEGFSKSEMHAAVIDKLKAAVPVLESRGKTAIVEPMNPYNHPAHCLYGSDDGIALCEAVGSPNVKLNWDLFHMQRYEGNLIDNLRKGQDHIGYVQIADSPDRNEPLTGEVNFSKVLQAVHEIGYTRPVGLECIPLVADGIEAARRVFEADRG